MYTLISAKGVRVTPGAAWGTITLSTIVNSTVDTLLRDYRRLLLTIRIPELSNALYTFALQDSPYQDTNIFVSLTVWLTNVAHTSLPLIAGTPTIVNDKKIEARDLFQSGYNVDRVSYFSPNNTSLSLSDKQDIKITRANTDISDLYNNALISINGLLTFPVLDTNNVFLMGAGSTLDRGNQNTGMFYNCRSLGGLSYTRITADMIIRLGENIPYYEGFYLRVNKNILNKTSWMVYGGILQFPYKRIFEEIASDATFTTFLFTPKRLPILQRYADTRHRIKFKDLGITNADAFSTDVVSTAELYSDAHILAMLLSYFSFIVTINTPRLYVSSVPLEHSISNKFVAYQDVTSMCLVHHGEMGEYWKVYEDGYWGVNFTPRQPTVYDYDFIDPPNAGTLTDTSVTQIPVRSSLNAMVVSIGYDDVTYA